MAGCTVLLVGFMVQLRRRAVLWRPVWTAGLAVVLRVGTTVLLGDEPVMQTPAGPVTVRERMWESANIAGERARADYTVNHRHRIWQVTWQLVRERPVLGQGPGAYGDGFVRIRKALQAEGIFPVDGWTTHFDARFAHNEYLHLWSESGFPALVGFMGLVGGVLLAGVQEGCRRHTEALVLWGGLGMVVVALVHGSNRFRGHGMPYCPSGGRPIIAKCTHPLSMSVVTRTRS